MKELFIAGLPMDLHHSPAKFSMEEVGSKPSVSPQTTVIYESSKCHNWSESSSSTLITFRVACSSTCSCLNLNIACCAALFTLAYVSFTDGICCTLIFSDMAASLLMSKSLM